MLDGRWRTTVEQGLEPVGQGLHRAGITADGLTVFGLVFAIGTALLIAAGHLLLGVFGVVLTGLPDILDGRSRARAAAPAPAAPSSTRSPTASPTRCCSSASPGTSPDRARRTTPCWRGGARAARC